MDKRILIINHDKDMVDILEMIFIHQLYHVDICHEVNIDFDQLLINKPDAVILGSLAEEFSLSSIYGKIRQNESAKDVPVIFLTNLDKETVNIPDDNFCIVNQLNFFHLSNQVRDMIKKTA